MRSISVSTDVFAAIWHSRQEGEESEDTILRRLLRLPELKEAAQPAQPVSRRENGFTDERSGVHFREGMQIHRTYKGVRRVAIATAGRWLDPASSKTFRSLHKLSQSVNGEKHENAWRNWKYTDNATGEERLIDDLRKA